jgi:hypothetical protein
MFETIHKVNMNANLGLIVNCYHFITTNNKEPCSMNSFFSYGEDNAMHSLCNFQSHSVILMFLE